jgi:hypothetical protein
MRAILALAILLLAAAPAAAQTTDTTAVGAALSAACPGARVRLYRETGGPVQGGCGPVLDGRLLLRDAGTDEREVPLQGVREVWVHERQTRKGALLGAGIGAGTLVLTGVLLVNMACYSSECANDYLLAVQWGALIGGGTGAVVGAGIGYLSREWERTYPRPE